MICGKCGHDAAEGSRFCSVCGHTFSGRIAAARIFKTTIGIIVFIFIAAVVFMFGNYFGKTEIGKTTETPDIIAVISEKIKEIAYIPIEMEFTQAELNTEIRKSENKLQPLQDLKLTLTSDGSIALSCTAAKNDISELFANNIPDIVVMFLPEQVPIFVQATPYIESGELIAGVKSISVGGITLGKESLVNLGIDDAASDIIASAISSQYGQSVELTAIAISEDKSGEPVLKIGFNYHIAKQ